MSATVALHPCTHFQAAVKAKVATLKNPHAYDLKLNGCKGRLICSSKQAWIAAKGPFKREGVLKIHSYATIGPNKVRRYEIAVEVSHG